jgi:hypothetical protein
VENFERNEESFYIPLIKTLEIVLSDTKMADLIIYKKDEGVPAGSYPKHGSKYQIHPLFSEKNKTKILVRIQLSYEGMGTTNSIRGHSSIHNREIFYFTIQNFLPQRTFISRVILVIKKNGF